MKNGDTVCGWIIIDDTKSKDWCVLCKCKKCGELKRIKRYYLRKRKHLTCTHCRFNSYKIGQKIGKFTIVEKTKTKRSGKIKVICLCGNIRNYDCSSLTHISSCGKCNNRDIIGERFGKLKVISYIEKRGHNNYFKCICDCSNEKEVAACHLISGKISSCRHCSKNEIIGKKFGCLTVLKHSHKNKNNQHFYECICSCKNKTIVNYSHLISGITKSCGHIVFNREKKLIRKTKQSKQREYRNNKIGKKILSLNNYIRKRDRGCIICKTKENICIHHIFSFNKYESVALSKSNCLSICYNCHKEFHSKYGYGDNTSIQFYDFLYKNNVNIDDIPLECRKIFLLRNLS